MIDTPDMRALAERFGSLPPYAVELDIHYAGEENGRPLVAMPYSELVIGRPGFLHGGAIAGLLEMAAITTLRSLLAEKGIKAGLKQINVTTSFMRGGMEHMSFAAAKVVRLGRNMANVEAVAWQAHRDKPIATAQMAYLIRREN